MLYDFPESKIVVQLPVAIHNSIYDRNSTKHDYIDQL